MRKIIQIIIIISFYINLVQGQFYLPDAPKKIYPVQDYAGVLSKIQIEKLNQKLVLYSKKTSTEILISIIQDLHGEDPNFLAAKWGERWKIGKFHKNNGIVILLSINDKKISIQNGYGLEPYLTDFLTKKIIKEINPMLKNHLYYQAIDFCTKKIFKTIDNKNYQKKKKKKVFYGWNFFICMSFLFFVSFLLYRKRIIDFPLLNTLFLTNFLFKNNNSNNHENDDNFDGFGGGGHFGGGGSSGTW
ncbi:TPM domain-containing protein [Blattabacterium cuenoti]|uniref:TPM domain-containing protein n=1 Tax=Blattabacterium cuenoti TaxID=1653831 RepID=UPI00163CEF9A|nr:TPM domain-containing protein [Blattabacterium cuenoti]